MFDEELRRCVSEVLGVGAPQAEDEPVRFYSQWLAERNLGLVPIADPGTFAWSGQWIAAVRAGGERHAVVMYGSPSGPWLDPAGVFTAGASIDEGWLVAPLDLHLPTEPPSGRPGRGVVSSLLVAPEAEAELTVVEEAVAAAGRGLEGDRYAVGRGTFSGRGRGYELTLVESEVLDELGLPYAQARRNVVTSGIELNALVGRRFRVGEAECVGRRLAEPCAHLERVSRPGLLRPLVHRAGLRADILVGGRIRPGDEIVPLDRD
jgi:hypothetical protein